jgi:sugar/nucleoside kinase (ribokinase family)
VLTQDILDKFSFIKLNESESRNNYGLKHPGLIITLGSKGAYYGGEIIPQENPQQTIDVSGAGDTFVAAFVLKFFETLEERPSIEYANKMASIVVSKRGVVTP